jgi:hypothetical protein
MDGIGLDRRLSLPQLAGGLGYASVCKHTNATRRDVIRQNTTTFTWWPELFHEQ